MYAVIARSSANNNSPRSLSLVFYLSTSMTITKTKGLEADPWCNPIFTSNFSLFSYAVRTFVSAPLYLSLTITANVSRTPFFLDNSRQPFLALDHTLSPDLNQLRGTNNNYVSSGSKKALITL